MEVIKAEKAPGLGVWVVLGHFGVWGFVVGGFFF